MTESREELPLPQEELCEKDIGNVQDLTADQLDDTQRLSTITRDAIDRALDFVTHASNETLGACLVGLCAGTYIIFGRLGLVLIGVVMGIALHATWESKTHGERAGGNPKLLDNARRRELGLEVVRRLLDWRASQGLNDTEKANIDTTLPGQSNLADFSDFRPETAQALNVLTDAVIRDYVRWWYSPILPTEMTFPATCRQTFTYFLVSLSNNLSRKRPADTFLDFVTNSSSIIIIFISELASALTSSPTLSAVDAINTYVNLKPDGSLAQIMDQKHQHRKLLMVADDILQSYLDPSVYRCSPTRVFLREILANVILDVTLQKCARADWINDWIVYLLEDGEPEIMNVIDDSVDTSNAAQSLDRDLQHSLGHKIVDSDNTLTPVKGHLDRRRRASRAEEAMEEAMREAQRLTQLIQEEEAKRLSELSPSGGGLVVQDDISEGTTHGVRTPSSSQSDANAEDEKLASRAMPDTTTAEEAKVPSTTSETSPLAIGHHAPPFKQAESLTLHHAKILIYDESGTQSGKPLLGGKRGKPQSDYLIQVEPLSTSFPGWMIPRTYADFEMLHGISQRISKISGITFTDTHPNLPSWKALTPAQLREQLEIYLSDAISFEQLAESEGMKRFLDKDRGLIRSDRKGGFWPTPAALENMGKGMLDVFTKAPNHVADTGKAFLGGVSNAMGGPRSIETKMLGSRPNSLNRLETSSSIDLLRDNVDPSPIVQSGSSKQPHSRSARSSLSPETPSRTPIEPRRSFDSGRVVTPPTRPSISSRSSTFGENTMQPGEFGSSHPHSSPSRPATPELQLPPPPSAITDNYTSPTKGVKATVQASHTYHTSSDGTSIFEMPIFTTREPKPEAAMKPPPKPPRPIPPAQPKTRHSGKKPLSEQETQVTVELLFAVINELYNLSSAWNIRRTLLTAAKTFLLRPGNPQLENIRLLLQESVLEANTSDFGIAGHIYKVRENCLPTEEELSKWPPPLDGEAKEALREKARRLLVQRGMPQALTSVMGAAASGEALGKVFDCLQVEEVAKGLMFGLLLQGVRAVTQ